MLPTGPAGPAVTVDGTLVAFGRVVGAAGVTAASAPAGCAATPGGALADEVLGTRSHPADASTPGRARERSTG
ncbi:hypothetical protein [Streptomyces sp. Wb2n-11]|uniref:hypothetical protein n=1 Tax=Streptomyces sp. Wb2n-11 TaxID=1030533 RepID=UPI000ACE26F9|nr:hypothetical protein [Streptomyces sp. Wb2n-11]